MLICLDCRRLFEEPKQCVETHGLDTPPYEVFYVCPYCGGDFIEARKCDSCDEFLTTTYVKTDNGERYCENCYNTYDLGDED